MDVPGGDLLLSNQPQAPDANRRTRSSCKMRGIVELVGFFVGTPNGSSLLSISLKREETILDLAQLFCQSGEHLVYLLVLWAPILVEWSVSGAKLAQMLFGWCWRHIYRVVAWCWEPVRMSAVSSGPSDARKARMQRQQGRSARRVEGQIVDVPVIEVVKLAAQERIKELVVDVPVPQISQQTEEVVKLVLRVPDMKEPLLQVFSQDVSILSGT